MIQARLELDEYTVRVLDTIKGKFGLKNRSEALRKMTLENGNEYVELIPNESVLKELDEEYSRHIKKYPNRKMNEKELKKLLSL